jgi:hypothetical protein
MRVSLLASVIAHIAILLGALVSWGSPRMYDWRPPTVEVDIVPSDEAPEVPKEAELKSPVPEIPPEPPKQEVAAKQEAPAKPELQRLDPPKAQAKEPPPPPPPAPQAGPPQQQAGAAPRTAPSQLNTPPVAPPKPLTAGSEQAQSETTKTAQAEKTDPALEQAETAARLAELLNISPEGAITKSTAPPSNELTPEEVNELKARISKCWTPMPAVEGAERTLIIIRVAFSKSGALAGEPQLIQAPAVPAGPLVLKNAVAAVQKCQPYGFLPPNKYKDWRVLDLAFTPNGIS